MKRIMMAAVLSMGLLFYCPVANAEDSEEIKTVTFEPIYNDYISPSAGFEGFVDDIECEPIYPEPEVIEEPDHEPEPLPHYIFTDEDADLLLRIAALEAGNQGVEGMAHVMQVVLNRWESDRWPNSIHDVLFQKGQFATASALANANITDETRQALEEVRWGNYISNEAFFFESLPGIAWADCHTYLFTYKGHDFYK